MPMWLKDAADVQFLPWQFKIEVLAGSAVLGVWPRQKTEAQETHRQAQGAAGFDERGASQKTPPEPM